MNSHEIPQPGSKPAVHGWRLRLLTAFAHLTMLLGLPGTGSKLLRVPLERRAASVPARWMLLPMPEVRIERSIIPGRGGPIPVKLFRPRAADAPRLQILFIHGGGFVAGCVDSLDYLCTNLCDRLGAEVTAVDYRLAPENPYPAALEDCEDVLEVLAARPLPIVAVGDSAGGNLVAALCLAIRGRRAIRRQVLIYPLLDLTLASASIDPPRHGLVRRDMEKMVEAYLGASGSVKDPCVSPLHAADLTGLPPALIVTADADPIRDDGFRYAVRLREAGVPVRLENYIGMPHAFLSIASVCPAAPVCIDMLVDELRE